MKRFRSYIPNIGLSILSFFIILMALEITFRFKAHKEFTKGIQVLKEAENNVNNYSGEISLRHIIRLNDHSRIIYELIPNLKVIFLGKPLTTNAEGFRAPQYSKPKNPATVRIIGLGDSFMFGWGVSDSECYLSLLQNDLNGYFPEVSWEVLNTAVPGYNTVMEAETLNTKGLLYHPDLVVIHFVGNDIDLPNFIIKKENYFTARKSFLFEFISNRLRKTGTKVKDPLVPAPSHIFEQRFENDPDRAPEQYKEMVGKQAYHRAMKKLKALSLEYGFELLLVTIQAPDFVRETCAQIKVPIIETIQRITQFMESDGIEDYLGSVLTRSVGDPHPSAIGHRIIAECILEYLETSSLISKFTKTTGVEKKREYNNE